MQPYLANSSLIDTITFKENAATRMTTTKTWDNFNRLKKIESMAGASAVSSHAYAYNSANQRTSVTNVDNVRWVYEYDKLGQVTSGKKYWADGTIVAGQQFEYDFDDIGNRKYAASGGNEWGSNLRYANYTVNSLNQYSQRTVPPFVDVLGSAKSNATVTVNDTPTYRKGEYFRAEVEAANGAGALWLSLTNRAVLPNGSNPDIVTNTVGNLFVPRTPETFTYDLDGNQTSDGRWTNRWDAENRLIAVESLSTTPDGAKRKLVFGYDWQGRRTSKIVSNFVAGTWVLTSNVRFVYDQWNLRAELNATNSAVINSYMWGLDLSGNEQSAVGIGGLVAMNSAYFCTFDGRGDVATVVKAANGAIVAQYEYGPFGETIRANGEQAVDNPFQFSTRYTDRETGLLYYGRRYYNPAVGRWLNGDPLGERATRNLWTFVANDPATRIDPIGLSGLPVNVPPFIIILTPLGPALTYDPSDPDWQWHHPISYNNTTRDFKSHPLVKRACVDLESEQRLVALGNHAGRHSASYHDAVEERLNKKWRTLGARVSREEAAAALNEVVDGIVSDINAGKLKPYDHKDIIPIPASVSNKRQDSYGYMKLKVEAAKKVGSATGKAFIFLNVWEHVKALIFFINNPNVEYDDINDVYRTGDGSIYDSDGHYLGQGSPNIL